MKAALWIMSHRQADVWLFDTEEEAASMARGVMDGDDAVVSGVQFENGIIIPRKDFSGWAAYSDIPEREYAYEEPGPMRQVFSPFNNLDYACVPEDYPSWVGA